MENIKKQSSRAYVLLESLLALALLSAVTTYMLGAIRASQQAMSADNRQIETMNTAKMALDAGVTDLSANGVSVRLSESDQTLAVTSEGKEVLRIGILEIKKQAPSAEQPQKEKK